MGLLPAPVCRPAAVGRGTGPAGQLAAADFPIFLAACRRYLPRGEFAQVARLYYDTAEATDAWLYSYGAARDPGDGHVTAGFEAALTGWLRDSAIGPAPCGPAALVRLRAVQAALFARAIVLTWQPTALGPQPASRLPGSLTPEIARALQTAVRTDAAAATALSVHLNQGPAFFGMLQLGDVAPNGSAIRGPAGRPCPVQRGPASVWKAEASGLFGQVCEAEQRSWQEFAAAEPIRIPAHARQLFAAHLAYRRTSGAAGTDPYFVHPAIPGSPPKAACVRRSGARRRIGLDLPWTHGDDCRYGSDIGLTWRGQSWLAERGLRLARTGPSQDLTITPPRPIACARPRWISGSQA